ncbi:Tripartite-type tricarboxylate transporter, receptor component TctC [Noviherbaspirillum humi]|uniref:Tripartite-type tricarboxylate transporter, receptor component TctC n=1 Tax=Noviherbaspirillum humi TaxID=1688639 RepID=A0A239BW83_9BURK|nr:tripartite tricarboxylate transporter substrate binding protein [Noviherbaspirillum humi]SNS11688.1 Tripartite-type tricarboxylate transporter, receptor component TctC [Noviherbaspirillum humi]
MKQSLTRRHAVLAGLAMIAGATLPALVHAQDTWPSKPIRIIVPFTAGSGTDIIARSVGEKLSQSLGQPVIVENKPGAGGTVGASQVAKSPADGYTLLVHSAGHAANAAIYGNLNYDTVNDFVGISLLATLPNVLVVAPNTYKSVAELVNAAKAKPGSINYASAGNGSATHMNAEKFRAGAKFDGTHVPYKGTPEAMSDTASGRVDFFFAPMVSALPMIKDKRLVPLALGSAKRSDQLPDVPTTVEAGVPNSDFNFWVGMLAPAKTPPEVVQRLNSEVQKILRMPDIKTRFSTLGAEPQPMDSAQFNTFIKSEVTSLGNLVKNAGIKPN